LAVVAETADEFGGVCELSRELFSTVNTHVLYTSACTHTGTSVAKRKGEVCGKHVALMACTQQAFAYTDIQIV